MKRSTINKASRGPQDPALSQCCTVPSWPNDFLMGIDKCRMTLQRPKRFGDLDDAPAMMFVAMLDGAR